MQKYVKAQFNFQHSSLFAKSKLKFTISQFNVHRHIFFNKEEEEEFGKIQVPRPK